MEEGPGRVIKWNAQFTDIVHHLGQYYHHQCPSNFKLQLSIAGQQTLMFVNYRN